MDVYSINQVMQFCNIINKVDKSFPSYSLINKIVYPIMIKDNIKFPPHIIPIINKDDKKLAEIVGKDIKIQFYTIHICNLINLN